MLFPAKAKIKIVFQKQDQFGFISLVALKIETCIQKKWTDFAQGNTL